ncbi:MAG: CDP-diacylglycerol--glycerol-3-phosphate 3-phosphatidyltransferase [Candidatus Margulisiibacteriota bacterium]|jgi:CDP-diacylglycerol--glycerol-3-phosphate 3-phosphatidyltransferase
MIFKNIPNALTILRILGVMIIFFITPFSSNLMQITALIIFAVCWLTDLVDGWVARKFNLVSDFGKLMDPLADKILVLIFLPLIQMQVILPLPVFIILLREYLIMAIRVLAAKKGQIIAANNLAKFKTGLTLILCFILLARVQAQNIALPIYLKIFNVFNIWVQSWPQIYITILIWSTVLITLWSFFDYLIAYLKPQKNESKS